MTPEQIDEIEARAAKATPGPWTAKYHHNWFVDIGSRAVSIDPIDKADIEPCACDAEFIASARMDVPTLVAELKRARELLELFRDNCPSCEPCNNCTELEAFLRGGAQ